MNDTERFRPARWWLKNIVHNIVVHPWLPLADALDACGFPMLPRFVYWAHDASACGLDGGG